MSAAAQPGARPLLSSWGATCEHLRDAVKRAMDTWAINHQGINFLDVSEECAMPQPVTTAVLEVVRQSTAPKAYPAAA